MNTISIIVVLFETMNDNLVILGYTVNLVLNDRQLNNLYNLPLTSKLKAMIILI